MAKDSSKAKGPGAVDPTKDPLWLALAHAIAALEDNRLCNDRGEPDWPNALGVGDLMRLRGGTDTMPGPDVVVSGSDLDVAGGSERRYLEFHHPNGLNHARVVWKDGEEYPAVAEQTVARVIDFLRAWQEARVQAPQSGQATPVSPTVDSNVTRYTLGLLDGTDLAVDGRRLMYSPGGTETTHPICLGTKLAQLLFQLRGGERVPWGTNCTRLRDALQNATGGELTIAKVKSNAVGLSAALDIPVSLLHLCSAPTVGRRRSRTVGLAKPTKTSQGHTRRPKSK